MNQSLFENEREREKAWPTPPPAAINHTGCPEDLREFVIWIACRLVAHEAHQYMEVLFDPTTGAFNENSIIIYSDAFRRDVTSAAEKLVTMLRLAA